MLWILLQTDTFPALEACPEQCSPGALDGATLEQAQRSPTVLTR